MAGLNCPEAFVPGPLYAPVPVILLVTVAVATDTPAAFSQSGLRAVKFKIGVTANVAGTVMLSAQPFDEVTTNFILNAPSPKLWVGFCAVEVLGLLAFAFGSLKFHNQLIVCPSVMVLVLLNCTCPFAGKHPVLGIVKPAIGFA